MATTRKEKIIKIVSWIMLTVVPAVLAAMIAVFTAGRDVQNEINIGKNNSTEILAIKVKNESFDKLLNQHANVLVIHEEEIKKLKDKDKQLENRDIELQIKDKEIEASLKSIDLNMMRIITTLEIYEVNVNRFWEKDWKELKEEIKDIKNSVINRRYPER